MVTRCSCIASSSADCVLGGVRLISSASTMFAKIGPGANTICRRPVAASSLMMSVPVMSDGIKSGVNWMRLNFRSSTCASVAMSSVFARPGTPTMRLLPPTNSVTSTSSTTSFCPTMRFSSSVMICLRPAFILSASATSSTESKSAVVSSTFVPRGRTRGSAPTSGPTYVSALMNHPVHDVVDAELVRLVRLVDRFQTRIGKLPELRDVGVEVHHDQQPLGRIVVLEDATEDRCSHVVVLRDDVEVVDLEKRMKDRMRRVQIDEARAGQDVQHLLLEVAPAAAPLGEVVEDHEPALEQVLAKVNGLVLGEREKPGLRHVRDRIPEHLGIVEAEDVRFLHVRVQVAQLVQNLHEVALARRVVVRPRNPLRDVRHRRTIAQAHKCEPAVVRRIGHHRLGAAAIAAEAALRDTVQRGRRHEQRSGDRHGNSVHRWSSFFAWRSRIAFVFSARSVSSFS